MVDHKMIVIDDVRYRLEDAKDRGLVDANGKLTRKARSASRAAAKQRVTGDETLGTGTGTGSGSGDGAGAGAGAGGSGSGSGDGSGDGKGGSGDGAS